MNIQIRSIRFSFNREGHEHDAVMQVRSEPAASAAVAHAATPRKGGKRKEKIKKQTHG
jgi:hypothetical protein